MIVVLKDGTEVPCDILGWSFVDFKLRPLVMDGNRPISLMEACASLPCGCKAYPASIDPADIVAVVDGYVDAKYPPSTTFKWAWLVSPDQVRRISANSVPVAQSEERGLPKPEAVGSTPSGDTNKGAV